MMDEETFDDFVSLIIKCVNWDGFTDVDIEEIEIALYDLRKSNYNNTVLIENWNPLEYNWGILILLILIFYAAPNKMGAYLLIISVLAFALQITLMVDFWVVIAISSTP